MKKLTLLLVATVMVSGMAFADGKACCKKGGKCCKDKKECSKDAKESKSAAKQDTRRKLLQLNLNSL